MLETGPTSYRPCPRRLECRIICVEKASHSLQLSQDPSVGPVGGSNAQPPARQSDAPQHELHMQFTEEL